MADANPNADKDFPTWIDLIDAESGPSDQALELQIEYASESMTSGVGDSLVSRHFGGFAEVLARAAALRGSGPCRPAIAATEPFLPKAAQEMQANFDKRRAALAVNVLSYINTIQCCGGTISAEAMEFESSLPTRLARRADELYESKQRTMAFACLALGKTSVIDKFIVSVQPATVEPGKIFGPNMPALISYLAAAMEQRLGPEMIEAAWEDFLAEFPMEVATETLSWSDLMWCARAVLVQFKKQPLETVADTLHQLVNS